MKIELTQVKNVRIVSVKGVVSLSMSGKELSKYLKEILEEGSDSVLIDLENIEEVDSTGLGELVAYLQLFAKQGRKLAVVRPTKKIRMLFQFVNLHKVLRIFNDLDEAIAEMSQG
jgi:anti-sigma B factor antagonist